jgi:hypothetical protein
LGEDERVGGCISGTIFIGAHSARYQIKREVRKT